MLMFNLNFENQILQRFYKQFKLYINLNLFNFNYIINERRISVIVNGKEMEFENITILKLLKNLNLDMDKVVVEVNFEIISRENYQNFMLDKEDKIEIISLVGGG